MRREACKLLLLLSLEPESSLDVAGIVLDVVVGVGANEELFGREDEQEPGDVAGSEARHELPCSLLDEIAA